ncbi:MAG: hypothetical protein RLY57_275 [Candidatus Parcubacteria bacterium]|jgi:YfiH family protein
MKIPEEIVFAFSNKQDGNMSFKWGPCAEVIKNREVFLAPYQLKSTDMVMAQLEHGETITTVNNSDRGRGISDGESAIPCECLMTNTPQLILSMVTADCFPIALFDPKQRAISLIHLGWKPTNKKLAFKAVEQMKLRFGSNPADIQVFVGPGIRKDSYQFPLEVVTQHNLPEWKPYVSIRGNTANINLLGFIIDQLVSAGVLITNIQDSEIDTASNKNYYSHYRSDRTGEPEGRFVTIIMLK